MKGIPIFRDTEVHWAHAPGVDNPNHSAQHETRFDLLDRSCDVSFICDADVALVRPMDSLMSQIQGAPTLAGAVAHYHFPWGERPSNPDQDWPELARAVIGKDLARPYRYTLMPKDAPPKAPFYINYGVFAGPPSLLADFHARDLQLRPAVEEYLGGWWAPQVSLALTCADLELPTLALPMRYNYPNDKTADTLYPKEMNHMVFVHYLRQQFFQRERIFAEERSFRTFLDCDLSGSDRLFRDHVIRITGGAYPFPR